MSISVAPGARIGPYVLREELGRGGMGVVFKAEEERTGRLVALKLILGQHADELFLERFRREGRAAAAVVHPNVASLHLAGEDRGVLFLAFELLSGGSLEGALRKQGRLPWREAVGLAAQVARGLEAIHAAGLVHRDL